MAGITLASAGLLLVILGFILAFVAIILLMFRAKGSEDRTRGAGIVLIGPIPIVFGSDRESVRTLMVLAIVLIVIVLVVSVLLPTFLLNR